MELNFVRADGSVFVGEVGSTQFTDDLGKARTVITIRDITEQRQAQMALAESEERYRAVVHSMSDGLVLQDAYGIIVAANPAAEEILGRKAAELIGMTSDDASWHSVYEDEQPFLGDEHPATVARNTGASQRGVVMGISKPQGGQTWISVNSDPILDGEAGEPKGAVVTFHDITESRQAHRTISEYAKQLENSVYQTLNVIANMVEMRDPYTAGHERNVATLARDIAKEMGWDEAHCRNLEQAGLVHDIGKIAIPAEILARPSRLTSMEYQIVQSHASRSYEILKDVDFPFPIAEIVYQHHERMDGSGYPRGLKGDEISVEARVLAVADVVESMASHRPYRAALGMDAALEEIKKNRGTLYDPEVADALLRLINKKGYQLPHGGLSHKNGPAWSA